MSVVGVPSVPQKNSTPNVVKVFEMSDVPTESVIGSATSPNGLTPTQLPNSPPALSNDVPLIIDKPNDPMVRPELTKLAKKIIKGMPHARGDMDARVGRTTNYTWFCGYLMGFVVDDANQVITAFRSWQEIANKHNFLSPQSRHTLIV